MAPGDDLWRGVARLPPSPSVSLWQGSRERSGIPLQSCGAPRIPLVVLARIPVVVLARIPVVVLARTQQQNLYYL